jgi:hypothetical protein
MGFLGGVDVNMAMGAWRWGLEAGGGEGDSTVGYTTSLAGANQGKPLGGDSVALGR